MFGHISENPVQCSDTQRLMCGNSDAMRSWLVRLQDNMTADLVDYNISPVTREGGRQARVRLNRGGVSSKGEHFIADKVKPDSAGFRSVKVKRFNRLSHVRA